MGGNNAHTHFPSLINRTPHSVAAQVSGELGGESNWGNGIRYAWLKALKCAALGMSGVICCSGNKENLQEKKKRHQDSDKEISVSSCVRYAHTRLTLGQLSDLIIPNTTYTQTHTHTSTQLFFCCLRCVVCTRLLSSSENPPV